MFFGYVSSLNKKLYYRCVIQHGSVLDVATGKIPSYLTSNLSSPSSWAFCVLPCFYSFVSVLSLTFWFSLPTPVTSSLHSHVVIYEDEREPIVSLWVSFLPVHPHAPCSYMLDSLRWCLYRRVYVVISVSRPTIVLAVCALSLALFSPNVSLNARY